MAQPSKPRTKDELILDLDDLALRLAKHSQKVDDLGKQNREQQTKIGKLKDIARFYRGQRDRVDAYLSAVIDAADLQRPMPEREFFPDDVHTKGSTDTTPIIPLTHRLRPRIQEPVALDRGSASAMAAMIGGEGSYAPYRDNEPERNWEDF